MSLSSSHEPIGEQIAALCIKGSVFQDVPVCLSQALHASAARRCQNGALRSPSRGWDRAMPELSRFFGIIIRMFAEPSERHHTAHFHAYYQEHVAVFSISPVALISGSIPQRQQRLVEAWAELHQEELLSDWNLLQEGRRPAPIAPLQ
jgi:hypothetical protein